MGPQFVSSTIWVPAAIAASGLGATLNERGVVVVVVEPVHFRVGPVGDWPVADTPLPASVAGLDD